MKKFYMSMVAVLATIILSLPIHGRPVEDPHGGGGGGNCPTCPTCTTTTTDTYVDGTNAPPVCNELDSFNSCADLPANAQLESAYIHCGGHVIVCARDALSNTGLTCRQPLTTNESTPRLDETFGDLCTSIQNGTWAKNILETYSVTV